MINSIIIKNPTADQSFYLKEKVVKIKVKSSSGFFNEIPVTKKGADVNISFEILGGKKASYSIFLVINGVDNLVDSGNYNLGDAFIPVFKYSKNIFVSSNKQSEYLTLKSGQYGIKITATEGGKIFSETVIINLLQTSSPNLSGFFSNIAPKRLASILKEAEEPKPTSPLPPEGVIEGEPTPSSPLPPGSTLGVGSLSPSIDSGLGAPSVNETQILAPSIPDIITPTLLGTGEPPLPETPEGFFDEEKKSVSPTMQVFTEIKSPKSLQIFDEKFFQFDENGKAQNYIYVIQEVIATEKPKNKAFYKILLKDKQTLEDTVVDFGDLMPFFKEVKTSSGITYLAEITFFLSLFKTGFYEVQPYAIVDGKQALGHSISFTINVPTTKTVTVAEIQQFMEPGFPPPPGINLPPNLNLPPPDNLPPPPGTNLPPPPKIVTPEIFGTQGIGNVTIIEEDVKDTGLQAPYLNTYLYQKGKNKVLFEIKRTFLLINKYDKEIQKLQDAKQYKIISNFVKQKFIDGMTANIYMSEEKPEKLFDIVKGTNLFKSLNISNGELTFENYLDVNKDYYFIVGLLKENPIGPKAPKYVTYAGVQKIKIIKDQELYFLDNKQISYGFYPGGKIEYFDFIDKEKIKIFLGKTFIEPKFTFSGFEPSTGILKNIELNIFTLKQNKFDSSQTNNKYIKLRVTSKKTNRKIDFNLNYSFISNIQPIKSYEEIKNKDNKKLITTLSVFFSAADKENTEAVLDFQFDSFMQEVKKFIQIYNIENNLQIYELPLENNKGELKYSLANINNLSQFTMSFLEYVKKQEKTYNPNNFSYNIASKILATAIIKVA